MPRNEPSNPWTSSATSMPEQNRLHYAGQSDLVDYASDLAPSNRRDGQALSVAACSNVWITVTKIVGGRNSCVDVSNSLNITITAGSYWPCGQAVFHVRGGATEVHLKGRIEGHGSTTDVDLGDASDPAAALTKRVYLDLTTADGSPVKVRAMKGWMPVVLNPEQPYEITVGSAGLVAALVGLFRRLRLA